MPFKNSISIALESKNWFLNTVVRALGIYPGMPLPVDAQMSMLKTSPAASSNSFGMCASGMTLFAMYPPTPSIISFLILKLTEPVSG